MKLMVGQVGFEPTIVKLADLQSAALATRRLTHMVIRAGLEPCITALKGLCPDHLDERIMLGSKLPRSSNCSY